MSMQHPGLLLPPDENTRRLIRVEAALLGLEDATSFSRPWAALHASQRGACAEAEQRIALHSDVALEADAAVVARALSALRSEVRGMATLPVPVSGPPPAREPCQEQLLQHQELVKAAGSLEHALATELALRLADAGARVSSARMRRSEVLRSAAAQAATPASTADDAVVALDAAARAAAREHGERRAEARSTLDEARARLAAEEARLGPSCERLRATAASARQLCRRREEVRGGPRGPRGLLAAGRRPLRPP